MSSSIKILAIALFLTGSLGCNKGLNSQSSDSGAPNNGQQTTPVDPAIMDLAFKGIQAQGDKVGRVVLELDRPNEAVILVLPLPTEILAAVGSVPSMAFPNLPGASLFLRPDGTLAVSIPLKYLVRNGQYIPTTALHTLPSGDPLPAFPAGEGAEFGLDISAKYKIHLYVGVSAAAVFIETADWDSVLNCKSLPICPALGPWQVRNETDQEILGYVAFVYAKSTFHSGAFVTAQLPPALARFIDDHIKP
jgi:hypothetical protein